MRRLGGFLLEPLLFLITLGVGYFVWELIVFARGQTPGKQALGMRIVKLKNGRATGFGRTFLREVIAKPVVGVLAWATFGIVDFWLLWDRDRQELWDKVVGTIVVNDSQGLTRTSAVARF